MPRLGSAKSSNGCTTCKIRRVKCDETHPACRRCTSTGRKCDGFKMEFVVRIDPRSYQILHKRPKQVEIFIDCTHKEVQAHQFFVHRLVPGLTRVTSSAFWDTHVLRAALSERSVWLAISAMSELVRHEHEVFDSNSLDGTIKAAKISHALQWYTKSVSEMQKHLEHQSSWSAVCGMTAIIYFCIECVLNNLQNAQLIYQRAVSAVVTTNNYASKRLMSADPVAKSTSILFDHIAAAHGLRPASGVVPPPILYTRFSTMEEARTILGSHLVCEAHEFVDFIQQERLRQLRCWLPPPEIQDRGHEILAKLKWWESSLVALREYNPNVVDVFNWAVMHLIQLNYIIWVSAMMKVSEIEFDKYHDHFKKMLRYAQIVIEADACLQPLFSFDTRVIPSLTFVATRCRHPSIRREALDLLQVGPRIENTRKASSAISMVRRIIAIEEAGDTNAVEFDQEVTSQIPSVSNRLVWVRGQQETTGWRTKLWLRFGRWQLDAFQNWSLTDEIISLDSS